MLVVSAVFDSPPTSRSLRAQDARGASLLGDISSPTGKKNGFSYRPRNRDDSLLLNFAIMRTDIESVGKTEISEFGVLAGRRDKVYCPTKPYPYQPRPHANTWGKFNKFLQRFRHPRSRDLLPQYTLGAWLPSHIDPEDIYTAYTTFNHLLVVSDGSGKDDTMAFTWVIASPTTQLIHGCAMCPGYQCSLRSKAAGQLAALLFTACFQEYYKVEIPHLEVYCDNSEVSRRGTNHHQYGTPYPNTTMTAQFDLTEQIYQTTQTAALQIQYKHVKGHQDDDPNAILSWEAELNVFVDKLADTCRQRHVPDYTVLTLPTNPAVLYINDKAITTAYCHHIHDAFSKPAYVEYLTTRFHWPPNAHLQINWRALALAIRRIGHSPTLVKICNRILPTNATLAKWKYQPNHTCPLCEAPEDFHYLLQCPHPTRCAWKQAFICSLQDQLPKLSFHATRIDGLCSCLTEYLNTGEVSPTKYGRSLQTAISAQSSIGWDQMFMGRIVLEWTKSPDPASRMNHL
eukprot:jgi/Psemu1/10877/gm1.10877_g